MLSGALLPAHFLAAFFPKPRCCGCFFVRPRVHTAARHREYFAARARGSWLSSSLQQQRTLALSQRVNGGVVEIDSTARRWSHERSSTVLINSAQLKRQLTRQLPDVLLSGPTGDTVHHTAFSCVNH